MAKMILHADEYLKAERELEAHLHTSRYVFGALWFGAVMYESWTRPNLEGIGRGVGLAGLVLFTLAFGYHKLAWRSFHKSAEHMSAEERERMIQMTSKTGR